MMCDMEGRSQSDIISNFSGGVLEVVGGDGGVEGNLNWGVSRCKEQSSGKMTKSTKVVNNKGDKGNVIGI
jgi:hypothetical protein